MNPVVSISLQQGRAVQDIGLLTGYCGSNCICFPNATRCTGIYTSGAVRCLRTTGEAMNAAVQKAINRQEPGIQAGSRKEMPAIFRGGRTASPATSISDCAAIGATDQPYAVSEFAVSKVIERAETKTGMLAIQAVPSPWSAYYSIWWARTG